MAFDFNCEVNDISRVALWQQTEVIFQNTNWKSLQGIFCHKSKSFSKARKVGKNMRSGKRSMLN